MKKFLSLLLTAALILLLGAPAYAQGSGMSEPERGASAETKKTEPYTAEEVLYGVLDGSGKTDSIYAVVILNSGRECEAEYFGPFADVKNLSDTRPLKLDGDRVSLEAPEGRFYFQSTLKNRELPWDIDISYSMDGEELEAGELGGRSGELGINISVKDGGMEDSSFYDGYLMQITVTLDSQLCRNITAEGASVANSGANKLVNFSVMPGTESELSLTADVVNFSMPGITFAAVPFSMGGAIGDMSELTDGLKQLTDAISQLSSGALKLSDGAGQLQYGAWLFGQGLYQLSANSSQLVSASEMFLNMFNMFKEALTAAGNLPDTGDVTDLTSLIEAMDELCRQLDSSSAEFERSASELELARTNIDTALAGVSDTVSSDAAYISGAAASMPESVAGALTDAYGEDGYAQGMASLGNVIAAANAAVTAKQQWQQVSADYDNAVSAMYGLSGLMSAVSASISNLRDMLAAMSGTSTGDRLDELIKSVTELANGYAKFHEGLVAYTGGVDALAANWGTLYDGIVQLTGGTVQLSDGTSQLNDGTKNIPDTVDEMLSAYTGGSFTAHSFLSDRNTATQAVQFVLTTEEIELSPEPETDADGGVQQSALEAFWARFISLFS